MESNIRYRRAEGDELPESWHLGIVTAKSYIAGDAGVEGARWYRAFAERLDRNDYVEAEELFEFALRTLSLIEMQDERSEYLRREAALLRRQDDAQLGFVTPEALELLATENESAVALTLLELVDYICTFLGLPYTDAESIAHWVTGGEIKRLAGLSRKHPWWAHAERLRCSGSSLTPTPTSEEDPS
jgi:hypothetical protein